MKQVMLSAHAALASMAMRADTEIEIQAPESDRVFQRYDIIEPTPYSSGAYKMRCKRLDRDPTRAKVKAARKQRRSKK